MAANNPSVTASDIITDVETRLGNPGYSSLIYLPWISYAYQRTNNAIAEVGQQAKEEFFGDSVTYALGTASPNEYPLTTIASRFGGMSGVWVKYGATGDKYNRATKLASTALLDNPDNITTSYFSKATPIYYVRGGVIGFLPVPPEANAVARLDYVKRPLPDHRPDR